MYQDFKKLFFTDTSKDTSVIFLGTLVNVAVGGMFFILAPRILGPQAYGLFAVVMATGLMAANFANFGIDTGILRFLTPEDKQQNDRILKLAFYAYLIIGISVFVFGLLISTPLASFLQIPNYANLIRMAFLGVIFMLLTNFFVASLQTKKLFLQASIVNISSNVARLLILALASYFFTVDLYFLTALFFTITIVSALVGKIFVPLDFLKVKGEKGQFKNFFGYNFWIAAALAISSIPIDNYILVKAAGPLATGIFAAPMKILTTAYQFAGSFSRVLAPRFSSFDTNQKSIEFAKKAFPFAAAISAGILTIGFFANPAILLILGNQYQQSADVFKILSIGMAFFFADTIPMAILLYYLGKSKIAFAITIWHYLIYTLLLMLLVKKQGAIGAATAFSISESITFLTLSTYVFLQLKKND